MRYENDEKEEEKTVEKSWGFVRPKLCTIRCQLLAFSFVWLQIMPCLLLLVTGARSGQTLM